MVCNDVEQKRIKKIQLAISPSTSCPMINIHVSHLLNGDRKTLVNPAYSFRLYYLATGHCEHDTRYSNVLAYTQNQMAAAFVTFAIQANFVIGSLARHRRRFMHNWMELCSRLEWIINAIQNIILKIAENAEKIVYTFIENYCNNFFILL